MGFSDRENKRSKENKGSNGVVAGIINDDLAVTQQPIIVPKEKEESRSKRVNLVVKPSVYNEAQKKCKRLGISVNEAMNQFLEAWIKD